MNGAFALQSISLEIFSSQIFPHMSPNIPSSPPPIPVSPLPPPPKKTRWLLYGCGGFLALFLIILATVAITLWWIQRPIRPVVLSAQERATVDEKLRQLGGEKSPVPVAGPNRGAEAVPRAPLAPAPREGPEEVRAYVPGTKVFQLTEREINGLLNANTDLGNSLRLEFADDALNAYVTVPIPQDFPIGGGKMFRARARFRLSLGNAGAPYAILDDVTVFGLSLPKAWLGGIKGENLIGEAIGERNGSPLFKGIKSLRLKPGALVLEVED